MRNDAWSVKYGNNIGFLIKVYGLLRFIKAKTGWCIWWVFLSIVDVYILKRNGKNNEFLLSDQYEIGEYTDLFFLRLEQFF